LDGAALSKSDENPTRLRTRNQNTPHHTQAGTKSYGTDAADGDGFGGEAAEETGWRGVTQEGEDRGDERERESNRARVLCNTPLPNTTHITNPHATAAEEKEGKGHRRQQPVAAQSHTQHANRREGRSKPTNTQPKHMERRNEGTGG